MLPHVQKENTVNEPIHTEVYNGFTIEIHPDQDPANPRTEFDNVGTMICFHKRRNLGDKHEYRHEDYSGWDEMEEQIAKDHGKNPLILSLYLYDHGGITISTSPFSCRWDSGQVGFIVCPLKKAKEEWGTKGQLRKGWDGLANFTLNEDGTHRTLREAATLYLEGEVKDYDDYLRGNVYGFVIKDASGNDIDDGSCWGFMGDYDEYCLNEARSTVDAHVDWLHKQHQKRKKIEIRHRVPLEKRS